MIERVSRPKQVSGVFYNGAQKTYGELEFMSPSDLAKAFTDTKLLISGMGPDARRSAQRSLDAAVQFVGL